MACIDHGQKGSVKGYGRTRRVVNGRSIGMNLHRAVFYDHNGYWPECVRHTCNNTRCINPEHLIPGTNLENVADRLRDGGYTYGEAHHNSRLTDKQRDTIRCSTTPTSVLAKRYGVSKTTIKKIRRGYVIRSVRLRDNG